MHIPGHNGPPVEGQQSGDDVFLRLLERAMEPVEVSAVGDTEVIEGVTFGPEALFGREAAQEIAEAGGITRRPSMWESAGGVLRRGLGTVALPAMAGAQALYESATREPKLDIPELVGGAGAVTLPPDPAGAPPRDQQKIVAAAFLAASPAEVATIVRKHLPGARVGRDEDNYLVVRYKDNNYYINKPGVSAADLMKLAGAAVAFYPAFRVAAQRRTLPGQALTFGAASGATSVAMDGVVQMLGAEQELGDILRRAGATTVTAAPTYLGGALLSHYIRKLRGNKAWVTGNPQAGYALTPQGMARAKEAGLDPKDLTSAINENFANELLRLGAATDPAIAATTALAKTFGIELSRPQATLLANPGWEAALGGGRIASPGQALSRGGPLMARAADPYSVAALFRRAKLDPSSAEAAFLARQRAQVADAARRTAVEMGQGAPDDPLTIVTEDLAGRYEDARQKIADAYADIGNVEIIGNVPNLRRYMDAKQQPSGAPSLTRINQNIEPHAYKIQQDLYALADRLEPGLKMGFGMSPEYAEPLPRPSLDFEEIMDLRREINLSWRNARKGSGEQTRILAMKRTLDRWIDDLGDNAFFNHQTGVGDPGIAERHRTAIRLKREISELYGDRSSTEAVDRTILRWVTTDPTPEQAANYLMAQGRTGQPYANTSALVRRLKKILGGDSAKPGPGWGALKQAIWGRVMTTREGDFVGARRYVSAVLDFKNTNPTLWKELFTNEERTEINNLYRTALLTLEPEAAPRAQAQGFTFERLARGLTRRFGTAFTFRGRPGLGMGFFILARTPKIGNVGAIQGRLLGPPPTRRGLSGSPGGAAIPIAGAEAGRHEPTERTPALLPPWARHQAAVSN